MFVPGKWVILSPKMAHPCNSESVLRILFKFCTMKEDNRCMEIILMVFPKKILFRANGPFRTQNGESSQLSLYSPSGLFYNFTQWKRPREMWKLCFLWKKSYSGQFGYFGSKMVCPHNIGSALSFFFSFTQ